MALKDKNLMVRYRLNIGIRETPKRVHFASSEDPDEMQHYAAFDHCPHCKGKQEIQRKEYQVYFNPVRAKRKIHLKMLSAEVVCCK